MDYFTLCANKGNDCRGADITGSLWFTWTLHSYILSAWKWSAHLLHWSIQGQVTWQCYVPMYLYKLLLPAFQNPLMQQPLAHLYFLTILEQLQKREHNANFLIRIASWLDEVRTQTFVVKHAHYTVYVWTGYILQRCNSDKTPDTAKMMLFTEKQAVVQILCQQLISFIDPRDPKKIQDVSCMTIA